MNWWTEFWAYLTGKSAEPPYRQVASRVVTAEGEHVILECGHKLAITHHRRAAFQCEACQRDEQPKDYEGNL